MLVHTTRILAHDDEIEKDESTYLIATKRKIIHLNIFTEHVHFRLALNAVTFAYVRKGARYATVA